MNFDIECIIFQLVEALVNLKWSFEISKAIFPWPAPQFPAPISHIIPPTTTFHYPRPPPAVPPNTNSRRQHETVEKGRVVTRKGQRAYKVRHFFFLFQYLSNVPPHPNSAACCRQSLQLPTPPIHPATTANTTRRVSPLLVVFLSIFECDREGNLPSSCFLLFWMRRGGGNPPHRVFLCFEHNEEGFPPPRRISFCFGRDGEGNLPSSCFLSFWMRREGRNSPRRVFLCFEHNEEGGTPPRHIFFCFGCDGEGESLSRHIFHFEHDDEEVQHCVPIL